MDVVWLKRGDVRLHDHGPIAQARRSGRPWILLFVYEPDQLRHPTMHGSHVEFCNEGLVDMEKRIGRIGERSQQCITLVQGNICEVLETLHQKWPVKRILAHEETGHMASYERDKRVRRWCRNNMVTLKEFPQTGATRALNDRDDFSKLYNAFIKQPQYPSPKSKADLANLVWLEEISLRRVKRPGDLVVEGYLQEQHSKDRQERQRGGESRALQLLDSFLKTRARGYSRGISSPSLAWSTCSRLSPYITFGHISLRHVVHALQGRLDELKDERSTSGFRSDLLAFQSRIRWRSHFIQKLESQPEIELRAMCQAYQGWQPGQWDEKYYQAWATGQTGYVMVDACMRCLLRHGWVNFRMRAMLVSFAVYNLWLDWKRIAPHLARCFLDYEPGIHYPQLQMQSGTTGINAMRVYNVVKQGQDQDPKGIFIRKYIPELANVPDKFIHQPHLMSAAAQQACNLTIIHPGNTIANADQATYQYPVPIVDAQANARIAKQKLADIRKQSQTRQEAQAVYLKHGSRLKRKTSDFLRMTTSGGARKKQKSCSDSDSKFRQQKMSQKVFVSSNTEPGNRHPEGGKNVTTNSVVRRPSQTTLKALWQTGKQSASSQPAWRNQGDEAWTCSRCTLINHKYLRGLAPVCEACGHPKGTQKKL